MMENLSRVRDYASILPTGPFKNIFGVEISVKENGDEYAFHHLQGAPYLYSNLLDRMLTYLQSRDWVSENELNMKATQNRYPAIVITSTIHRLKQLENVGYSKKQFKLYEHGNDSEIRQESLDEPF